MSSLRVGVGLSCVAYESDLHDGMEESSEEDQEEQHRRQTRKRRKLAEPHTRTEVGEKDHLFFSLDPNTHSQSQASQSQSNASTIMLFGHAAIRHQNQQQANEIESETYLQSITMRSLDGDTDAPPIIVTLDRHDVRLLADQAEWITRRYRDADDDDAGADSDADLVDGASIADGDDVAPIEFPLSPTSRDLEYEKMNRSEWQQLQRERFGDLDTNRNTNGDEQVEEDATKRTDSDEASLDRDPSLTHDAETIAEEERTRSLMSARGRIWQFNYEADSSTAATSTEATTGNTAAMHITTTTNGITAGKRPPPPPPRKRPPPPPPPPTNSTNDMIRPATSASTPVTPPEAQFQLPFKIPDGMQPPLTSADHRVISSTVRYLSGLTVGSTGFGQHEILLKMKQRHNPLFDFLNWDHPLHTYYTWLKEHPNLARQEVEVEEAKGKNESSSSSHESPTLPDATLSAATIGVSSSSSSNDSALSSAHHHTPPPPKLRPPPGIKKVIHATNEATKQTSGVETLPDVGSAIPSSTPTNSLLALMHYDDDDEDDGQSPAPASSFHPPSTSTLDSPCATLFAQLSLPIDLLSRVAPPPPPDTIPTAAASAVAILAFARQVKARGTGFESLTRAKERNNSKYEFLQVQSKHHPFYQWMKTVIVEEEKILHTSISSLTS